MNYVKTLKTIAVTSFVAGLMFSMTGCGDSKKVGSEPEKENVNSISSALAIVESDFDTVFPENENDGKGKIEVSITEPATVAGYMSRVTRDVITNPDENKALIEASDNNICAKISDKLYSCQYNIKGANLETARFVIRPVSSVDENADTYGINYFTIVQKAKAQQMQAVECKYRDELALKSVKGEFTITLDPETLEVKEDLGYEKIIISGNNTSELSDITCKFIDGGVSFNSSNPVGTVKVECISMEKDENGDQKSVVKEYTESAFEYKIASE